MSEYLIYLPFPELRMDAEMRGIYVDLLQEIEPSLVVFDSWASFLSSAGLSENENSDVEAWNVTFAQSAKRLNVTSLIIDHTPHDGGRSRGAARKKEAADVQWRVKKTKPFDRSTVGEIVIIREKDREGWLPESVTFSVGGSEERIVFARSSGTIEQESPETGLLPSSDVLLRVLRAEFRVSGATPKEAIKAAKFSRAAFYRAKEDLLQKELVREEGSRLYCLEGVPCSPGSLDRNEIPCETSGTEGVPLEPNRGETLSASYSKQVRGMSHHVSPVSHGADDTPGEGVSPLSRSLKRLV